MGEATKPGRTKNKKLATAARAQSNKSGDSETGIEREQHSKVVR